MRFLLSKIVDIHTHHPSDDPSIDEVTIIDIHNFMLSPILKDAPFCFGLHPWFINDFTFQTFKNAFDYTYQNPFFFALGEIGLDKVCDVDYQKQIEIFEKQLVFAKSLNIPRIILHSVKSHSEILFLLKKHQIKQKILIHDYYSSEETANQFLSFDCYFSFGSKLFNNFHAQSVIQKIPIERIFLETDDQTKYNIFKIYDQASEILNLSKRELIEQMSMNYSAFSK